jgi:hypothetical protein
VLAVGSGAATRGAIIMALSRWHTGAPPSVSCLTLDGQVANDALKGEQRRDERGDVNRLTAPRPPPS